MYLIIGPYSPWHPTCDNWLTLRRRHPYWLLSHPIVTNSEKKRPLIAPFPSPLYLWLTLRRWGPPCPRPPSVGRRGTPSNTCGPLWGGRCWSPVARPPSLWVDSHPPSPWWEHMPCQSKQHPHYTNNNSDRNTGPVSQNNIPITLIRTLWNHVYHSQ